MAGGVAVLHAVAVLEAHEALGVDEDGAERLIPVVEGLAREVDAAAQVRQIGVAQGGAHAATIARPWPQIRTSIFPVFAPRIMSRNASTAWSMPSTIVSS